MRVNVREKRETALETQSKTLYERDRRDKHSVRSAGKLFENSYVIVFNTSG